MKLLLFLFALMFPFFVFSQDTKSRPGTVSGMVLSADGQPIPYVTVMIKNGTAGAVSDEKGNFEIKKIKPGIYTLRVSLTGYIDSVVTVDVRSNDTTFLKMQLRATYKQLKEVIVAASVRKNYVDTKTSESLRLNLPLIEVPQYIVSTSAQLMADQGSLSMTEALRTVSGAQKTYGQLNDYSLMMRGTAVDYFTLYRNGIGGYWWNTQEDVAMVEKIEFIKGPANFMGGVSEGAGMTNIVTKQPVREQMASVNAGLGSFNLMRFTTDLGGPVIKNGKISYRFNAGVHYQHRAFQFGKAVRYFICPVVKYDINTKTSITAEYNYMWGKTSGNNDGLPSINGKMFALPRDFATADDKSDQLTVADNYYRVQLKHNFNDNWHLNVQLAYVNGKWGGHFMNTHFGFPVSHDTLYRYANYDDWRNFSRVFLAFVDGKFHTGKKIEHNFMFGPDYDHWGITDTSAYTLGGKKFGLFIPKPDYYIDPDSLKDVSNTYSTKVDLNSIAFYGQDNIKIAGKLIITVGGRFTHSRLSLLGFDLPKYLKNTRYDVFTPRAGLTWLFSDALSVYALYDQFFNAVFARNSEKKPFKPITGYDVETGMKGFFFNKKLGLNFSAYHTVTNNLLSPDTLHPNSYIQNAQVTSNGVDFDLTGNLTSALIVNANYEYTDARTTKNTDSTAVGLKNFGTPAHTGNLWVKYNLQKGRFKGLSFGAGYQYMGKRTAVWYYNPDPATRFAPAYNLLDAAISYSNERFNIGLNVYNITNMNYAVYCQYTRNHEWRYTPGEPVNFRISFGVNLVRRKNS